MNIELEAGFLKPVKRINLEPIFKDLYIYIATFNETFDGRFLHLLCEEEKINITFNELLSAYQEDDNEIIRNL